MAPRRDAYLPIVRRGGFSHADSSDDYGPAIRRQQPDLRRRSGRTDRVFRSGREQYAEELLQQPAYLSAGVLRPLTPRVRATLDYSLDVTGLERTVNTPALFEVPRPIVNHGARLAIDADRGAWSLRGWWNPVVRHRWRAWGLPGAFDPATRSYQRYGARLTRTLALRTSVSSRIEMSW